MIEIAHSRQMERAIKVAHAERSAAFAAFWSGVFSLPSRLFTNPKPQAAPAG